MAALTGGRWAQRHSPVKVWWFHFSIASFLATLFISANRTKLESIVWPEILRMAKAKVKELFVEDKAVVVLDAAVLLKANWHKEMCHQVNIAMLN